MGSRLRTPDLAQSVSFSHSSLCREETEAQVDKYDRQLEPEL